MIVTKVKKWSRFKTIMADLATANMEHEKFQLDDADEVYELVIQNSIGFTFDLEHTDTTAKADYEANYKGGFIIINDKTDT